MTGVSGPQRTTRPAVAGHGEARRAARRVTHRGRRAAGRVPLFVVLVLLLASVVAVPVPAVAANTLVPTPPMGFNDWNAFGCDVDEALIEQTADVLVSSGLADAGYEYVNIDDCWSMRDRGQDGRLMPDPVKFPHGIAGVADYVHSKGLKLGIYGDAGTKTCAGYPGSLGAEELDARTWAEWGVDYLKYDNCHNESDGSQADFIRRYTAMRDALDKVDRPIVYAICEWGQSQPWQWAAGVGDLWRTTGDVSDNWQSLRSIIAANAPLYPYAGPGHWNDPDMMEIGNGGMTDTEYRTHMSMWAMMAAPLLIGTDLRTATPETLAILGNRDIIAIDQDRLGVQGKIVTDHDGLMALDKPLANGEHAVALYNATDTLAVVDVPVRDTGLARASGYRLRDVWTGQIRQTRSVISAAVPAHGTVVYRVRPTRDTSGIAPLVTVGGSLGTLVPGSTGGTLTTTTTNRGADALKSVEVKVQAPAGWTVTAASPTRRRTLNMNVSLTTTWTVVAPDSTPAGQYPLTLTASWKHGSNTSDLVTTVVTAPPGGTRHLSTVRPVSSTNALGPVETDLSNGGATDRDGSLITIGGHVYTRGLGTTGPSEITYYLGGDCSSLTTDAGLDDETAATGPATFTVFADDTVAASATDVAVGEVRTLTADVTGANWLRLATTGDHTDWAAPVLTCGVGGPVQPVEHTLVSFESGTEDWTIANPGDGGSVVWSTAFHTEGEHGLAAQTPLSGNWFGRGLAEPLDLRGATALKFDVRAGASLGTVGEIAVQVGPNWSWCQGSHWAWTNPGASHTITETVGDIECPAGVTLDLSEVHAIWVFLNGGDEAYVDNVRVELS